MVFVQRPQVWSHIEGVIGAHRDRLWEYPHTLGLEKRLQGNEGQVNIVLLLENNKRGKKKYLQKVLMKKANQCYVFFFS